MAQTHRQMQMVQDNRLSENGNYDAGWLATCQCGRDVWISKGRATRFYTQRVMNNHLIENGVTPDPAFAVPRPTFAFFAA